MYKKRCFPTLLFLLIGFCIHALRLQAQPSLVPLTTTPDGKADLLYRISSEQARVLLDSAITEKDTSFFRHYLGPITDSGIGALPFGHYLRVRAVGSNLQYSYIPVSPFLYYIPDNTSDFQVQLRDRLTGRLLSEATLSFEGYQVPFDTATRSYRLPKANLSGILDIGYAGAHYYFRIGKSSGGASSRYRRRKLLSYTPLRQAMQAIYFTGYLPVDGWRSIERGYPQGGIYRIKHEVEDIWTRIAERRRERRHPSERYDAFLFFSKPKYRPKDTAGISVLLLHKRKKRWEHRPLSARIYAGERWVSLGHCSPPPGGGYHYRFALHDSLRLRPGSSYAVQLVDRDTQVYATAYMPVEQYELQKSVFLIKQPEGDHLRGVPYQLEFTAKDDNGLPMRDAHATITLTATGLFQVQPDTLFVPRKLWTCEMAIEDGVKSIAIPDSIFPHSGIRYAINATLRNAESEQSRRQFEATFYEEKIEVKARPGIDSIDFASLRNGVPVPAVAGITAKDRYGYTLGCWQGRLPYRLPLDCQVASYELEVSGAKTAFFMSHYPSLLSCNGSRDADSLHITIDNPRNLPFSYHLYRRDTEVTRGHGKWLDGHWPAPDKEQYYLALEYVWAGQAVSELYAFKLSDKKVNLQVAQPAIVYPGKEAEITITATDYRGRPLKDMSLLAYAYTTKFGVPGNTLLPDFSSRQQEKKEINRFSEQTDFRSTRTVPLHFPFWRRPMQLDTQPSFRFIYPGRDIEVLSFPAADSITQVAPFITKGGLLQPVHYVLLDGLPVYFGFTRHRAPYSFEADDGRTFHTLTVRTADRMVTIDSVRLRKGCKNMFSVALDKQTRGVSQQAMPDSLTASERSNYSRYVLSLDYVSTQGTYSYVSASGRNGVLPLPAAGGTAGPLAGTYWTFHDPGTNVSRLFALEPYYSYTFRNDLVKMTGVPRPGDLVPAQPMPQVPGLGDGVITAGALEAAYRQKPAVDRRNILFADAGGGKEYLQVVLDIPDSGKHHGEYANLFLFRADSFNLFSLHPGYTREWSDLAPGSYQLLLVDTAGRYFRTPAITVAAGGLNFARICTATQLPPAQVRTMDSLFLALLTTEREDQRRLSETIMGSYLLENYEGPAEVIQGKITDEDKEEIPGAIVRLRGTRVGTISDAEGNFILKLPLGLAADRMIEIMALGYAPVTLPPASYMEVSLTEKNVVLQEVTIYSKKTERRSYAPSVSTVHSRDIANRPATDIVKALAGEVAGVAVSSGGGLSVAKPLSVRGSLSASGAPLYVINGNLYNGDIAALSPESVASIQLLPGAEATLIYGARGAQGVLLITTRPGAVLPSGLQAAVPPAPEMDPELMTSGLRSRFSDDAYWQPALRTDKQGKARFMVKFPDDLTSWQTLVYATDNRRHTGQTSGEIRAYKPLSASLLASRFLVAGDRASFIGKSVNYLPDTQAVTTRFYKNDSLLQTRPALLHKYRVDTLRVVAQSDSLKLRYQLNREDGYFDGEIRSLPVMPRGTAIADGAFLSLDGGDTTFTIPVSGSRDTLYIGATASLLDVVLEEVKQVRAYKHLCNEQLSSKILAMLSRERLYQMLKKPLDKGDRAFVQEMVQKLIARQNSAGLWGWWQSGATEPWISRRVVEALVEAKGRNYDIGNLSFDNLVQPLLYYWEKDTTYTDLHSLKLMQAAGLKTDYEKYITRMERRQKLSLGSRLELLLLRRQLGLPATTTLLDSYRQEDMFGNIYWRDTTSSIYENEVQTTLTALQLLLADSSTGINRHKVVNWLLQQRSVQGWRNTYESAKVIEVLAKMTDLSDSSRLLPALRLDGALARDIRKFPWKEQLTLLQPLQVSKKGDMPVYFTWYQRKWDTTTTNLGNAFVVTSRLEQEGRTVTELAAGVPAQLLVTVNVPKDAEYVMIDIPVPAGCSFARTEHGYSGYELHREYDTDRVDIFCQKLPRGTYTYTVDLLPRFSGSYTLNPARAELMYFPVFYGREQVKRVPIR